MENLLIIAPLALSLITCIGSSHYIRRMNQRVYELEQSLTSVITYIRTPPVQPTHAIYTAPPPPVPPGYGYLYQGTV
jgi:hypothetical protein